MKRFVSLVVLAAAACGPAASSNTPAPGSPSASWSPNGGDKHTYKDEAGAFTIDFPVAFTLDVKRDMAGTSELVTTTASATTKDDRVNYIAMKTVISPAVQYDCERGINSTRDKTLHAFACKVTSEKPITQGKWPGREVSFECVKSSLTGILAVYCDDTAIASDKRATMYEVFAASSNVVWSEPDARAFLASFNPSGK